MNPSQTAAYSTLQNLHDNELLEETKKLVETERETTTFILHSFAEIESRRLYAQRGYPSLFAMAVEYLKYSAGAAERRISASRLLRQLPDVERKLTDGTLNLTVVAKAHTFFQAERRIHPKTYTLAQKREILASLENKSSREAERELLKISPLQLPNETVRPLSDSHTEIRLVVSKELLEQLNQLRDHFSHANPGMSFTGLVEVLARNAMRKSAKKADGSIATQTEASGITTAKFALPAPVKSAVPSPLRRQVWIRDGGCCTYRDPVTLRRCRARSFLELDHISPRAFGGAHRLENLRLVCKAHNQLHAIQCFGKKKMDRFLRKT
jgi:hypothetical protein